MCPILYTRYPVYTAQYRIRKKTPGGGGTQPRHSGHTDTRSTQTNLTTIPHNHPDPQTHCHARTTARGATTDEP